MTKQEHEEKFHVDHRLETYKSMITISVEGFKYLALLNGGAAAGLISGLAILKTTVNMYALRIAISCFIAGLIMNCIAYFCSYFTQNNLFNESVGRAKENAHIPFFIAATIFCLFSLAAFTAGCITIIVGIRP